MTGDRRRSGRGGFTLLELIVVVSILAGVAGIIALSLRLASGSIERGEDRLARMARLRAGIDILERAIRSADPTAIPVGDNTSAYFIGEPGRLRFLSTSSAPASPGGGFRLLGFSEADAGGRGGLVLSDASPFRAGGVRAWEGVERSRLFLPGARGLVFSYSPGPSPEGSWEWFENWDFDTEGRLPGAIRVEFVVEEDEGPLKTSFVVPLLADGR